MNTDPTLQCNQCRHCRDRDEGGCCPALDHEDPDQPCEPLLLSDVFSSPGDA